MKKKPNKSCSAMAILFLLLLTCSSAFAQDFESRSTSGLFVGVGVGVANRGTWVRKQTANYETGLAANLRIGFGRFLLDLEYHPNQVAHPDSALAFDSLYLVFATKKHLTDLLFVRGQFGVHHRRWYRQGSAFYSDELLVLGFSFGYEFHFAPKISLVPEVSLRLGLPNQEQGQQLADPGLSSVVGLQLVFTRYF